MCAKDSEALAGNLRHLEQELGLVFQCHWTGMACVSWPATGLDWDAGRTSSAAQIDSEGLARNRLGWLEPVLAASRV